MQSRILVILFAFSAAACTAALGLDELGDRPPSGTETPPGVRKECAFDESHFDDGCTFQE
jgi:hypothetical protein